MDPSVVSTNTAKCAACVAQIMMKLRAAKNLDARQAMLLEHAYFQVLPPFLLQHLPMPVADTIGDSLEKSAAAVH